MSKRFFVTTISILVALFAFAGCSGLPIPSTGLGEQDLLATQNALIIQAAQATATQIALETGFVQVVTQTAVAQITDTPEPEIVTATPTLEQPTSEPTATVIPPDPTATATLQPPTATPIVFTLAPTATPIPCNQAQFVSDVSVPDGSTFSPYANFTKTWRLRNVGTCTWSTEYDVVFYDGSQLSGPVAVDMPGNVAPGQTIDVSVNLTAPGSNGSYRGNWKLRDASGVLFGLGASNRAFYVDIKVENPTSNYPYDFTSAFCSAEWTTGAGRLLCPSPDNDSKGFVLRYDKPVLESGYIDNEPALLTHPQMVNDGVIRGKYPSIRVESGHHFVAVIGCARDANSCDVKFQLDYQIGDGSISTLATWSEVYDEKYNAVDVDLSSLAGKDVKFILTVLANGSSNGDRALWLAPRMVKK
jgi:hypothetical protein